MFTDGAATELVSVLAAVLLQVLDRLAVPGVLNVAVELEGVKDDLERERRAHVDPHALEPLARALLSVYQNEGVPHDHPSLTQRLGRLGDAATAGHEVVHDDRGLTRRVDAFNRVLVPSR